MIKLKNILSEASLKGAESAPSNKKLSQLSDNDKLKIVQSTGNLISFKVPDWSKGKRNFWTVISNGKIVKKQNLNSETIFILPGKGPEKVSPSYSSVKELLNGVDWDTMELRRESVNEAKPSVVGNMNASGPSKVLGKGGKVLGFVPDTPNAIATLIQDYPNAQAIEFKSPFFFDFNSYKSIKKGDKAWKELMSRSVDKPTKAALKKDFQLKESVNEAASKSPDFIVTSIPADAIPQTNISKADVGLGLSMFDALGRGWTLNNKDYKLDYHNGKVVLKLTSSGKTAVRVKSGHDPKYVQKIEKFANDYLSKYAKDIKK